MMKLLYALIAGLIQGLTEFLPVSSSAHLLFFHKMFGFKLSNDIFFDVAVHAATLVALCLFFRKDIVALIKAAFRLIGRPDLKGDVEQRMVLFIIVGSLPVMAAGFLFSRFIENTLHAVPVALPALFLVSLVFFWAEKSGRRNRTLDGMNAADALVIGAAQMLALIPGVSRSGITVSAGLFRDLDRAQAARFAFLISIPAVFGAAAKSVVDITSWASVDWTVIGVGFAAALASGVVAIGFFLKFLGRHPLNVFAWYRIGLSAVVLGWLLFLA